MEESVYSKHKELFLKDVNMSRLERYISSEKIDTLRQNMKGWYGRPIYLADIPGRVYIDKHGNFVGKLSNGYFASFLDYVEDYVKGIEIRPQYGTVNAGFASISDALSRASQGFSQRRNFTKITAGTALAVSNSNTLWNGNGQPIAGAVAAAAPGGTVNVSTDVGSLTFANPATGTLHLTGADVACNAGTTTLLIYDRLFSVLKAASSSATEAVSGTPTRYQSSIDTAADFAGDNFLFVEQQTALASTAHNWTVCQYTNESGTPTKTLPSIAGLATGGAGRLDIAAGNWFMPLASGDEGIKALTQMQCSVATITGSANFVIGHPIGFCVFPVINMLFPFDWLTNRDQAPRIFNNACIAFLEPLKPATAASTYTGRIVAVNAAP
jgi:hypothetical protein